jgi:hypothetical protein
MRKVAVSLFGIAAAALGAVALSAEPLKLSGTATDGFGDRSAVQGDRGKMLAALVPAGDAVRRPSETKAVGIAQAAPTADRAVPPAPDASKPTAVDDGEDPDGPGDDADRPGEVDDDEAGAPDDGEDAD